MFDWLKARSPLTDEQRQWIDERFTWLRKDFGEERLRRDVITPTAEFFPDRYSASAEGAAMLLDQLCGYMDVERTRIDLRLYKDPQADAVARVSDPPIQREYALATFEAKSEQIVIRLEQSSLDEPHSVISTLAHELGHVLLLADGRCDESVPDHEPLTDLLVVYFGLGIFIANTSIRQMNSLVGRLSADTTMQGYLALPEYAYALALYAYIREEPDPSWAEYMRPDLQALFRIEAKQLAAPRVPFAGDLVSGIKTKADEAAAIGPPHTSGSMENADGDPDPCVDDRPDKDQDSATGELEILSDDNDLVRSQTNAAMGNLADAEADLAEAIRRDCALAEVATRGARLAGRTL
jgi:NACalpha-BTF3-like transcription factor